MKCISALLALTPAAGFAYANGLSAYPNAVQATTAQTTLLSDSGIAAMAAGKAATYPTVVAQGTPLTRAQANLDADRA